jgi:diguanylate cyclase (GGDEF)-like protein
VRLRSSSKIWAWFVVSLVIVQTVASFVLPKSFLLTAITDWVFLALMTSASLAFAANAYASSCQQRPVWILLAAAYAIEAGGQVVWMYWEVFVKRTPAMSLGDACNFLAWVVLILGFALRPHVEMTEQHQRIGTLDLLLLLLAGIYLYLFLVIPWEYFAPEPQSYSFAYKFLALAQDAILLSIVIHGMRHGLGRWRHFYALLCAIVALDTIADYAMDAANNGGPYSVGSWYDVTSAVCIGGMTFAALLAHGLEPASERGDDNSERYWRRASRIAAPVTLVLPLIAAWSFLDQALPGPVRDFRVLLSLAAVVVFASVGIAKQAGLEKELANANRELLDASLTDPLTGVRNRRYFTNSIEADLQQLFRSYATDPSPEIRNRDLVFYLIDIDHFKRVNDRFGHGVGDNILVEVARRINTAARLSDAVIRWGGEEFLLLSRYTDRKDAHILANRVLESVGFKPYPINDGEEHLCVSCSIGWAAFPWNQAEPRSVQQDQVLMLADFALYLAKGSGRNRAVGLLPAGQTVHGGTVDATIFINGIPASPITTLGPVWDVQSSESDDGFAERKSNSVVEKPQAKSAASSGSNH